LPLGSLRSLATPVAWDLEDFSAWDKFLWTWRITGICAECHVFTYLRDHLRRWGILTAYEAMQAKHNTRVTVAGLNVRPHRPPTRSGEPVIFTLIEDESGLLHATIAGEAIDTCTSIFLTSPAVIVRGLVKRQGRGAQLLVEKVKPLRMAEMAAAAEDLDSIWERPWKMGANVLTRMVDAVGTARAADTRSGVGAI
jgi:error-prone DNA polymerase